MSTSNPSGTDPQNIQDPNNPVSPGTNANSQLPTTIAGNGATSNAPAGSWYIWTYTVPTNPVPTVPQWIVADPITITPVPAGSARQPKVKCGNAEGYECSKCKTFNEYAELNCPEESNDCTFYTCYACRKGFNQ
jgi:hypothetical protein